MDEIDFDLRDALAGYLTDSVKVWFNRALISKVAALDAELSELSARGDTDGYGAKEAEANEAKRELAAQAWTINLRSVSRRHKEDVQSKVFAKLPVKRDPYGFEDATQVEERTRLLERKSFEAYITSVVSPSGKEMPIEGDEGWAVINQIVDNAPEAALDAINAKMVELNGKADYERFERQSVDFLP